MHALVVLLARTDPVPLDPPRDVAGSPRADEERAHVLHRLQVVTSASDRMARSLEAIDVVTTLADIAADEVAGGAIVALSAEADAAFTTAPAHPGDERVRVRAVAHRDPDRQQALNDLVGRTIDTSAPFDTRAAEFPLWSRGRILGVLVVGDGTCSDDQRELLADLAGRASVYLDNAVVHAATRYVGLTLQQSLLPPALPEMDGVELAARYQPGVEGMEVGGDFYVAHPLPDGRLVAAIGDVMGRGVRAAATMGQLRSVLLAVAHDGDAPDVILGRMSSIAPDAFTLTFATLIVGLYDPRTRRLCVASAGHPPPLIAPPGAEAAFMEVPAGPPLGAPPSSYERVDVSIPAATAVVLYTDGLIERRGEEIDDGMERLRRALTGVRLPAEELCDHALVATSRRGGIDDDVAVLVLTHA